MADKGRSSGAGANNRRFTRGGSAPADWGTIDAEIIKAAIVSAAMVGGALRFGYTSDGGAYALGVYGDGDKPYTEYIRPNEDVEMVLRGLETVFLDIEVTMREKGKKSA